MQAAVVAGLASLPSSQGDSPPLDEQVSRQLPFMRADFRKALNAALFNSSPSPVLCVLLGRHCMTPSSCRQPGFQRGKGPGCVWANVFFVRSESRAGQRRRARGTS